MQATNPYKARIQAWVQQISDDLGVTYTELARRAKIDPATLTRFMNNPSYKPNLSNTTVQKIAESTGRATPDLPTSLPKSAAVNTLPVKGTAAAGLWKEVAIFVDEFHEFDEIPVVENPRYAGHRQYALLVEGSSINRQIKDGEYAVCVEWASLGMMPKDGQYVHVERSRGGLHEVTIKQVRIIEGRVELWPDSTDPRHQEPIQLAHEDEDAEVTIRGLVIGSFRQFG